MLTSKYTILDVAEQLLYMGTVLEVIVYLHMKNFFCKKLADTYFVRERALHFKRMRIVIRVSSLIYYAAAIMLLIILNNRIENIYDIFLIVQIVYFAGCGIINLTLRKQLVFHNLVWNRKRITCVLVALLVAFTYNVMSMDLYLTQPYINRVSEVMRQEDEISYNEENGVYTITTDKKNFKILQLTDIHLGGSVISVSKDLKALEACDTLIQYTEPDLVLVTGDLVFPMGIMSFSLNNRAPIMQFANFMRNIGVPWAFTYGNHDTEKMATLNVEEFDSLMKSLSYKSSGNLLYPYVQPDIYGRSNQMIEIKNSDGTLRQAVFLLDSNDYIPNRGSINEYDYIHDDQVEWYKKNVEALSEKEGGTIPSMVFFHIPLQEYRTANDLYEAGSDEVKYYYGTIGETMINKICCSDHASSLFDVAVELGSTKAMFCGHDHYNNQSVEYKGIRLTYGYSIDYLAMPGIEEDTEQRGATLITLEDNGEFKIDPYKLTDIQKKQSILDFFKKHK